MKNLNPLSLSSLAILSAFCSHTVAQQREKEPMASATNPMQQRNQIRAGNWNLVTPTLGGRQFWTDQFVHREWRIQQHVHTKHCRLLDPKNRRRAWGSFNACRMKFESLKKPEQIQPLEGKAVVLMHGLGRTRQSMSRLAKQFAARGYVPINMEYASTRASIADHAAALNRIIGQLKGIDEIYFVGHSMGNIVFRYYLQQFSDPGTGIQGDARIQASVMIAPPNQGAYMARVLKPTGLFSLVTGQSGRELASDWSEFSRQLATPDHPFGIIAGKFNGNPLFRVDNDTTVSVEETRLAGAGDFKIFDSMHATIMSQPEVIASVDKFFSRGYFVAEGDRTPIR